MPRFIENALANFLKATINRALVVRNQATTGQSTERVCQEELSSISFSSADIASTDLEDPSIVTWDFVDYRERQWRKYQGWGRSNSPQRTGAPLLGQEASVQLPRSRHAGIGEVRN